MAVVGPVGLQPDVDLADVGVGAILLGAAVRWEDRLAFRFTDEELTFAGLLAEAARFAHGLIARGVGPGTVVACLLPNGRSFPAVYYGTLLAGATFAPFNPQLRSGELSFNLADCAATVLVCQDTEAVPTADVLGGTSIHTVVVDDEPYDVPADRSPLVVGLPELTDGWPATPPRIDFDAETTPAHIVYTGGTTGSSKGVLVTHRSVVAFALQYGCWTTGGTPYRDFGGGITIDQQDPNWEFALRVGGDLAVSVTPWFHTMGINAGINLPMAIGMTQVIRRQFAVPTFLADMERFSATMVGGAPALLAGLTGYHSFDAYDLSSVRAVFSAAAPLPPSVFDLLQSKWPEAVVCEIYGLTEASGVTSASWLRSAVRKAGSVGLPVPATEIKIVPSESECVEDSVPGLPADTAGEVCVRGPQVMSGYLGRPDETTEVLSVDGWLRTGDIGVLDTDGQLSIVDRKKDTIIYMGYNIYPREIEEILLQHPDVTAAAVVGKPDVRVGELPVAFVVATEQAVEQEILAYVNTRVVPYKNVRKLFLVDEMPVSDTGKMLRRELRDRVNAGQTPASMPRTESSARNR